MGLITTTLINNPPVNYFSLIKKDTGEATNINILHVLKAIATGDFDTVNNEIEINSEVYLISDSSFLVNDNTLTQLSHEKLISQYTDLQENQDSIVDGDLFLTGSEFEDIERRAKLLKYKRALDENGEALATVLDPVNFISSEPIGTYIYTKIHPDEDSMPKNYLMFKKIAFNNYALDDGTGEIQVNKNYEGWQYKYVELDEEKLIYKT